MTLICEVNFIDFSRPLDSDSDSDDVGEFKTNTDDTAEYSSCSNDTEFEGDVQLDWNDENYNDFVSKKHWENYCATNSFTVMIPMIDRCRESPQPIVSNIVIRHKHDLNRKPALKRYCSYHRTNTTDKIFPRIYYKPTRTFLNWPGEYFTHTDHR